GRMARGMVPDRWVHHVRAGRAHGPLARGEQPAGPEPLRDRPPRRRAGRPADHAETPAAPGPAAPDRIFGVGFGVGPGVYGALVGGASFDAAGNVRLAPHITGLSSGEPVGAIPFDAPFW